MVDAVAFPSLLFAIYSEIAFGVISESLSPPKNGFR